MWKAQTHQTAADGIPHVALESSVSFLRDGYTYISRICDAHRGDAFSTRIMLTPVICMRGAEAAEIFWRDGRRRRQFRTSELACAPSSQSK